MDWVYVGCSVSQLSGFEDSPKESYGLCAYSSAQSRLSREFCHHWARLCVLWVLLCVTLRPLREKEAVQLIRSKICGTLRYHLSRLSRDEKLF